MSHLEIQTALFWYRLQCD